MYVFLNELSFCAQANSNQESRRILREMKGVIDNLSPIIGNDEIHVSRKLWEKEIEYSLKLNDCINKLLRRKKERDLLAFLRQKMNKGPYVERLLDEEVGYHECYLFDSREEVTGTSVAGATAFKGILVSLQNAPSYSGEKVHVLYMEGEEEISFDEKEVDNQLDPERAKIFTRNFIENQDIKSFEELWRKRDTLFPHLKFCNSVEKNLKKLESRSSLFVLNAIRRHLKCMEKYQWRLEKSRHRVSANKKKTPDYRKMGIETSIESGSTINKYGHTREFICPDGKTRLFTWHSKLKGHKNIRIHFYPPDDEVQDFLIGYVGKKLPTVDYPT